MKRQLAALLLFCLGCLIVNSHEVFPASHGKICLNFDAVGDSITDAATGGIWPATVATSLSSTGTNDAFSGIGWGVAVGGQNLVQRGATVDGHLASLAASGCASPMLFMFAGTNDIDFGGTNGAQTYALFQTYVSARIAAGWSPRRMVIVTMLPRNNDETQRVIYNNLLIGGVVTYGYRISRLELDPNIGCPTCNQNTAYYSGDQIHPNSTGQQIIANLNCLAAGLPSVSCPIY